MMMWRRSQVLELASRGYTQSDIGKMLHVDSSVISRDITYLNQQSKENIQRYIDEKLPNEYEKCLLGITAILKEAWAMTYQNDIDRREKIQALSLAKECYNMKLEMLTNSTVVSDAMKFVSKHKQNQQSKQQEEHQKLRLTEAQQQEQEQQNRSSQ
jgi:hypothetical protein